MRKSALLSTAFVLMLMAAPLAFACGECSEHYDPQTEEFCDYCEYSYCGYFACAVYQWFNVTYCSTAYPNSGDGPDACFTQEGIDKGWCGGADKIVDFKLPVSVKGREWQLVSTRVVKRGTAPRRQTRRG